MVEEYGRAGRFERQLPAARALYASHWAALSAALAQHMPDGVAWTEPTGGFFTWLTLPRGARRRRDAPGRRRGGSRLRPGPAVLRRRRRAQQLRLSFGHLTETELGTAVERLAGVIRSAHGGAEVV